MRQKETGRGKSRALEQKLLATSSWKDVSETELRVDDEGKVS